ncbi:hypothetical protein F0Q45_20155 [Mycobacterium simiae]|uniref:Lipoprotein LprH n=1 Tax=Mycobacterium simiae TaxID=1784 RepID=A0A5B1BMQ6_MYCSI|nr:hypothetical protein F0Q45_20155 [Mycobacterium simiae]
MAAVVATLCGCTTTVAGHATRAAGQPTGPSTSVKPAPARELLLQDGDRAPFGQLTQFLVGDNYFTSAEPAECKAALLLKDSPLRPAGSSDHAEAAYNDGEQPLYAESVDVYTNTLNVHDVVWNGFRAVSECHGEAIGVSPSGKSAPMRLSYFAIPADGVLVWTMSSPRWTCDYGLAVVSRVALVLSACDFQSGFAMAEWASQRRTQLDTRA